MDNLTLGASLKRLYPKVYDDIPDDQLGAAAAREFGPQAGIAPEDPDGPAKIWGLMTQPWLPELGREWFKPDETADWAGANSWRLLGEIGYQTYRAIIRPSASLLGVAMGGGLIAPATRRLTLAAGGAMGLSGAVGAASDMEKAQTTGARINAAVDMALSTAFGVGGTAAATLPPNVMGAPITQVPRVFRNWVQHMRSTPEQQAAYSGGVRANLPIQVELPYPRPPEEPKPRPISEPWYTFKVLNVLNDTLFKSTPKQKAPTSVPAKALYDLVTNEKKVKRGDAYWLGLTDLAERSVRSNTKVSWQDIFNTIQEHLTINNVFRGAPGPKLNREQIQAKVDTDPEVRRVTFERDQVEQTEKYESRYVSWMRQYLEEMLPGRLRGWLSERQGDPRYGRISWDAFNDIIGSVDDNPEILAEALRLPPPKSPELQETAMRMQNRYTPREHVDTLRAMASQDPNFFGLVQLYAELSHRRKALTFKKQAMDETVNNVRADAREAALRPPDAQKYGYTAGPTYPDYGFADGQFYEENSVQLRQPGQQAIKDRLSEALNALDEFENRTDLTPAEDARMLQLKERVAMYRHLSGWMSSKYKDPHYHVESSVGHFRWDSRMSRNPVDMDEGWTALAKEVQPDWQEVLRKQGAKNGKALAFEKVWPTLQEMDYLMTTNRLLRRGKFSPGYHEPEALPLFPDWRGGPVQLTLDDALARAHLGNRPNVKFRDREVPLWKLSVEDREILIKENEAKIAELHKSAQKTLDDLYGSWEIRETDYQVWDRHLQRYTYEPRREWYQRNDPLDFDTLVGPFSDDVNKATDLLLRAYVRRALHMGQVRGRQYQYIGIVEGHTAAVAQGYGQTFDQIMYRRVATPMKHPQSEFKPPEPPGTPTPSVVQQPMEVYKIRLSKRNDQYNNMYFDNVTPAQLEQMMGPEIAKQIRGGLVEPGGAPMPRTHQVAIKPLDAYTKLQYEEYQANIKARRVSKKEKARLLQEFMERHDIIDAVDENGERVLGAPEDRVMIQDVVLRDPADRYSSYTRVARESLPYVFNMPHPAIVNPDPSRRTVTYNGLVNAYNGITKTLLDKIAKEFGSKVEPAVVWVANGRNTVGNENFEGATGAWLPAWRLKVTDKLIESVLYGTQTVSP